jgi:hypothetical protein
MELNGPERKVRSVTSPKLSNVLKGHQMFLSPASPRFRMHVKPSVLAALAVVSIHQSTLGRRGRLRLVLLKCNPYGRPVSQQWGH